MQYRQVLGNDAIMLELFCECRVRNVSESELRNRDVRELLGYFIVIWPDYKHEMHDTARYPSEPEALLAVMLLRA